MKKLLLLFLLVAGGVSTVSADDYLPGSWKVSGGDWVFDSDTKFSFSGDWGTLTLNLAASTTYEFKYHNGTDYYSNSGAGTMTSTDCTNWTLYKNSGNCRITTTAAGNYIFKLKWFDGNPHLWVIYPTSEEYVVHFQNEDSWLYVYAHRYTTRSSVNSGTVDFPYKEWHGVNITSQVNPNNSDYYDLSFSDTFEKVIFNDGSSNEGSSLTVDFNSKEYWATKTTISKTAPSGWVGYTRSVTSGNWGTLCLPFAATITGADVYTIASKVVDGSDNLKAINLNAVAGNTVAAGKPYIFQATSSELSATYTGSYTAASADFGMLGNLSSSPVAVDAGNYVIQSNKVKKVVSGGTGVTCGQYRAYITLEDIDEAASRGAIFLGSADNETTGIESVKSENNQNVIFNLQGQRVKEGQKGLLIINGKKIVK